MPLGFLLFVALVRSGRRGLPRRVLACAAGTLLSLSMETLQNYLPRASSSNVDLGLNALGTALGVGVGAALHWRGGIEHWQKVRDRWFVARSAGGLALLVLWPIGLLFPTAVPFGLGHVLGRIQPILADLLADTPAAAWAEGWSPMRPRPRTRRRCSAGDRTRDRRARPAGAVPGRVHDRGAGLASGRARARRGADRRPPP